MSRDKIPILFIDDGIYYEATHARLRQTEDGLECRYKDGKWYAAKVISPEPSSCKYNLFIDIYVNFVFTFMIIYIQFKNSMTINIAIESQYDNSVDVCLTYK